MTRQQPDIESARRAAAAQRTSGDETMADATRRHADKEDLDQRTPTGTHGFEAGSPASDMTRQHSVRGTDLPETPAEDD